MIDYWDLTFLKTSGEAENFLKGMFYVLELLEKEMPTSPIIKAIKSDMDSVRQRMNDLVDNEIYGIPL